jgi:hypothetical protein
VGEVAHHDADVAVAADWLLDVTGVTVANEVLVPALLVVAVESSAMVVSSPEAWVDEEDVAVVAVAFAAATAVFSWLCARWIPTPPTASDAATNVAVNHLLMLRRAGFVWREAMSSPVR